MDKRMQIKLMDLEELKQKIVEEVNQETVKQQKRVNQETVKQKRVNQETIKQKTIKQKTVDQNTGDKNQEKIVPSNNLTYKRIRGNYQYYLGGKYISKKKHLEEISRIAKNEYRVKLLPMIEENIEHIHKVIELEETISNLYTSMPSGKQELFEPDLIPIEKKIHDFENATYEGLAFGEDDITDFFTTKNERVRSKSEKIIADELARNNIPYKYEKPLMLLADGKYIDFYPDFTTINRTTGEIKYIEHFGMMDNPQYYNNVLSKLDVYEKNGLLIGRNVLLFHESSYRPLSTRVINEYIREFLL